MTVEALSLTICLASGIFGRPAWTPDKCDERAAQIMTIAEKHGIDPLLMVAVNIQECDMREDVNALVTVGTGKHKKIVGIDACPMGVRIMGAESRKPHAPEELYEIAARRMEHWKRWCERGHPGWKLANLGSKTLGSKTLGSKTLGSKTLGSKTLGSKTLGSKTLSLEKHHFIAHYNQGNPVYASQVLGFLAAIAHRKVGEETSSAFTSRTREIVRRLTKAFRGWWMA